MKMKALLDSGANAIYIDKAYAQKMKLPLTLLADLIRVYNIDGTRNAAGSITHCAEIIIQFQEHREKVTAEVTDSGNNQMILGYTWLSCHNPEIDWTTGTVQMTRCPWTCQTLKGKSPLARQIESEEKDSLAHINSPATFQTMMNEIFSDMADVMVIYIDDLMIYTKTDDIQEHERLVKQVLKRLEEHDLFTKPEKCTFGVKEVEFLGMIVSREGKYLSRFNFKWLHKAGAIMGKADALSRREDHSIGIEKNNTGVLVIPPDQIRSVTEVHIATDADIIINTIKNILFDLKEPDLIQLRKQYTLKDHIFYDENGKIYVPEDQALCLDILTLHHDTPIAGHPGRERH
jgi:hypothetical protein